MFIRNILPLAVLLVILTVSCQKIFIKPDPKSDVQKNFEMFWNDLNNGYPYFTEDNIDWDARYEQYSKMVTPSTSISQLYTYMTQMLKGFSDGHLGVEYNGDYYSNEKTQPNLGDLIRANNTGSQLPLNQTNVDLINGYIGFNEDAAEYYFTTINDTYVSNINTVSANNGFQNSSPTTISVYGNIDSKYSSSKNILYVNIATFNTEYSIENLLQKIIIDNPNADAMILDLRMNEGGSLGVMWDAMSVFLPKGVTALKYGYSREKVGPLPDNFGPEKYYGIFGKDNQKFLKPIVVLTNRLTISAAEHATMAMREIRKLTPGRKIKIIGDYTFGATSFIVQRTLPCGIKYTLVNSKTWNADHVIVEKTGVKPDEQVFLTASKVLAKQDEQMERAIEIIKNNTF